MTLFYDSDLNAIVENHPDEWIGYDDDGRLIIDFDKAPADRKVKAMLDAAAAAVKASSTHELVADPETRWVGNE